MERKSGSSALGLILLIRCNLCQRASTVAGERLNPSCKLWQVAHERPLPPGNGMKKLKAPLSAFILSTPRWLESSRSISRIMASRLEASAPIISSCSSAAGAAELLKLPQYTPMPITPAISDNMNLVARTGSVGRLRVVCMESIAFIDGYSFSLLLFLRYPHSLECV